MTRRAATGMLAIALAALLVVPALGADTVKPPRRPFVGSDGLFARAKLGAYCVMYESADGNGVGQCIAAAAPTRPPRARIAVEPGDRIAMLFRHRQRLRDRPSRIHLSMGQIHDGELETFSAHINAHHVPGHPWKWRARAPAQVARANLLELFERFPAGDADYFVGLQRP
jgi:hypothetical protein